MRGRANRLVWSLLLLPVLLLSMACNLSAARRWTVGGSETPTPAEGTTPAPLPTPTEAVPAPPTPAGTFPCGDGVCDDRERQHPDLCPQDCPQEEVYVGEVELDMDALRQLQAMVDQGHYPWRLDPVEVARADGEGLGFDPAHDAFDLLSSPDPAMGQVDVLVLHGDHFYIIHLTQPVRVGLDGIWVIVGVERGL